MKYEGKVYGKISGKFIEMTETVKELEDKIKHLSWIKFSDEEPKKGEYVDVHTAYNGRSTGYEYEGDGTFYNNEIDDAKDVTFSATETAYNVTHWKRVISCVE